MRCLIAVVWFPDGNQGTSLKLYRPALGCEPLFQICLPTALDTCQCPDSAPLPPFPMAFFPAWQSIYRTPTALDQTNINVPAYSGIATDNAVELPPEAGRDWLPGNLQQEEECQCHCVDTVTERYCTFHTSTLCVTLNAIYIQQFLLKTSFYWEQLMLHVNIDGKVQSYDNFIFNPNKNLPQKQACVKAVYYFRVAQISVSSMISSLKGWWTLQISHLYSRTTSAKQPTGTDMSLFCALCTPQVAFAACHQHTLLAATSDRLPLSLKPAPLFGL